jgi:hypothetical protein
MSYADYWIGAINDYFWRFDPATHAYQYYSIGKIMLDSFGRRSIVFLNVIYPRKQDWDISTKLPRRRKTLCDQCHVLIAFRV